MSEFFLNDQSLHGQFDSQKSLLRALRTVLDARACLGRSNLPFYCDTRIQQRPTIGATTFRQAVQSSGNKELIRGVLGWLSKSGPFWASEPRHSPEDLFDCEDEDVTGSTLAEAASRHCADSPCRLFGFSPSRCDRTPIRVDWTRQSGGETTAELENFWDLARLEQTVATDAAPFESWEDILEWMGRACQNLVFRDDLLAPIQHEPFSSAAAREIQMLLRVLDEMPGCQAAGGAMDARGHELFDLWFKGHHARFTDESTGNIDKFSADLTFPHPVTGHSELCSWHGKVRLGRQYRIHFQWANPPGEPVWVAYIGPKLTKR